MSLLRRSAWHTVTCMALLTFILNNASLLNFDSLFFSNFFIGRNSMFSKRLTHLDWQKQCYHFDCQKQGKTKSPAHHGQPIPAPASPLPHQARTLHAFFALPTHDFSLGRLTCSHVSTHLAQRSYLPQGATSIVHVISTSSWPNAGDAFLRQGTEF